MKSVVVCLVAAVVMIAQVSSAQTDQERSAARSAAKSGVTAYHEGRFDDAVELLTRAESVFHAPTHLLFIARAEAKRGNLVEAKEAYLKVINERLDDKAPSAFVQAQGDAKTELDELQGRLASLKVVITGAERSEAEVTIDGKPLPNIALGVFTDASPGERLLVVSAPGKEQQEVSVRLSEGQKETVTVALADEVAVGDGPSTSATKSLEPAKSSNKKVLGYVLGGVGVAGIGVGSVFGVMTLANARKARGDEALCPDNDCSSRGETFVAKAKTKAMISNVGIGVGAALVAVGGYLIITAPKTGEEVARLVPQGQVWQAFP